MNWDLVPTNAIASVNLMPGSNPLFGLNALGGAVSLQTKTGFSHSGHGFAVSGRSFARYLVEADSGGNNGSLSYFMAGSASGKRARRVVAATDVKTICPMPVASDTGPSVRVV